MEPLLYKCVDYFFRNIPAVTKGKITNLLIYRLDNNVFSIEDIDCVLKTVFIYFTYAEFIERNNFGRYSVLNNSGQYTDQNSPDFF